MGEDHKLQRTLIALASAIAVTLGFLGSLYRSMADPSRWLPREPTYMAARLIDQTLPAEPVAPAKSTVHPSMTTLRTPVPTRRVPEASSESIPTPPPQPRSLNLFTRDGAVRLSDDARSVAPPDDARDILAHKDLLPPEPERFAWAKPADETLGSALMRKIYNHEWKLPWGTVVTCMQGVPTAATPIVIDCRPGRPSETSDELRAMRADPPIAPSKPQVKGTLARIKRSGRKNISLASTNN